MARGRQIPLDFAQGRGSVGWWRVGRFIGVVWAGLVDSILQNKANSPVSGLEMGVWRRNKPKQTQLWGRITGLVSPFCEGSVAVAVGLLGRSQFWYNGSAGPEWVVTGQMEELP